MRRQDPGLNKALATTHAHVGLLASVGAGMSCQVAGLDKPLATGHTHKGFLTRVGGGHASSSCWSGQSPGHRSHARTTLFCACGRRQDAGTGRVLAALRAHMLSFLFLLGARGHVGVWGRFLDGVIRQAPDHARAHLIHYGY